MHSLGFQQFRLRHHGEITRIEISRDPFLLMLEKADQVVEELKACGFIYVTMDLQGHRTGSMNNIKCTAYQQLELETKVNSD